MNFGNCANMGAETFVNYAKGFGVTLSEVEATQLKKVWLETFPEMEVFFRDAAQAVQKNPKPMSQTLTGRQRADCTYTSSSKHTQHTVSGPSI